MKSILTSRRESELYTFLTDLNLKISNLDVLDIALTHSSYVKDNHLKNNERLEFFGDAVLKLVISEYLMEKFPSSSEGELSKLRAYLISDKVLYEIARKINLKKYILLGKNERKNISASILSDCFEALLAVIYSECGLNSVRGFIISHFKDYLSLNIENFHFYNYKALLQEYTQDKKLGLPEYKTVSQSGPDHNKKFEVAVILNNNRLAVGKGMSKKEASQDAAKLALSEIKKTK